VPEPATARRSRRLLVVALVLVAAAAVAVAVTSLGGGTKPAPSGGRTVGARPAPPTGPPPKLFARGSFWNKPLGRDAPADPASPALAHGFAEEIARERQQGIGPWIETTESSTPLYTVGHRVHRVRVKLDAGPWAASFQGVLNQGVPMPTDARAAAGSDAHMTIYQPSSDTLWELWRAVRRPDGWHASWGGAIRGVSRSAGYYSDASWPGHSQSNWGASATSLPIIGGVILTDELRRGRIDHALALDVPDARAGVFAWPAQRTDGGGDASVLPEGARLRIDPAVDLNSLGLPPLTLALARAAQRYGMVVRDRTHHATAFYAEDPGPSGGDPYRGPGGLFDGQLPSALLERFPWDRLQVLRMSLCKRAPCPRGDSP
jgi:hypothetical protein